MTIEDIISELSQYPKQWEVNCRDKNGNFAPLNHIIVSHGIRLEHSNQPS